MRMTRIPLVCAILLGTVSSGHASRVIHQEIQDMIGPVTVIVVATVRDGHKVDQTNRHHYTLEITEVLVGELGAKELPVVYYEQGSPRFSIISPASGIEHGLKKGKKYLFLFRSTAEQKSLGVVLTRAEPEGRRETVVAAWKKAHPPKAKSATTGRAGGLRKARGCRLKWRTRYAR